MTISLLNDSMSAAVPHRTLDYDSRSYEFPRSGYSLRSLTLASTVVNCQLILRGAQFAVRYVGHCDIRDAFHYPHDPCLSPGTGSAPGYWASELRVGTPVKASVAAALPISLAAPWCGSENQTGRNIASNSSCWYRLSVDGPPAYLFDRSSIVLLLSVLTASFFSIALPESRLTTNVSLGRRAEKSPRMAHSPPYWRQ